MNPSRMKQFLVEERCVFAGPMALPTIPDFLQWADGKRAYRTITRVEKKVRNLELKAGKISRRAVERLLRGAAN